MQITTAAQKKRSTRDMRGSVALCPPFAPFAIFLFFDTPLRILSASIPPLPFSEYTLMSVITLGYGVWLLYFSRYMYERRERGGCRMKERGRERERREMGSIAAPKHSLNASVSGQVRSSRLQIPYMLTHMYAYRASG